MASDFSKIVAKAKKFPVAKKEKKIPISKLTKLIWKECRRIAFKLYAKPIYCYTCNSGPLEGANCQLGHFLHRSTCGAFLKYDMRNLRFQCFMCNLRRGGMGAEFGERLAREHGQEYVDELFRDKQRTTKDYDHYVQLLEQYKLM